ncbi:MAG: hypothetical protein QW812_01445 [Thermoplasmataceae archaeon]
MEGEILKEILVEPNRLPFRVEKYARRRADFAIASVAAICSVAESGQITELRIAVGAQNDGPVRLERIEKALVGRNRDSIDIEKEIEGIRDDLDPISDLHAGSEYRRDVITKMLARILYDLIYREGDD